jgi:two-component system response regulator YesN
LFKIQKYRSNKLLNRFLLSYVFILLVPLFIGIQSYKIAVGIVKDDIKRSNVSMLNQAKEIIDTQLQQVETLSLQIASNPRVNSLLGLKEPLSESTYYDFNLAIKDLSLYMINRDFITGFYIYFKNSNYILTSDTLYPADIYYDKVLKLNNENYNLWKDSLVNNYYAGKYLTSGFSEEENTLSSTITYNQSLPLSYVQKSEGSVSITLKKASMTKLFSSLDLTKGGWAYIQNKEGKIMASVSNPNATIDNIKLDELENGEDFMRKYISNKDMIITYTTSNYNGWKYVIVLPSDIVLEKLNSYKRINLTIFSLTILVGIAIALLLAYHNSKPFMLMVKQLKEFLGDDTSKDNDTFSIINGSISQLINTNKELQEDISNQKPLIQSGLLDKLFKGQLYNEKEFDALSSYVGLSIDGNKFVVLLLRVYTNDSLDSNINPEIIQELNVSKAVARGVILKHLGDNSIIHDVGNRTIAILLITNDKTDTEISKNSEAVVVKIKEELFYSYNLRITVGGGTTSPSLMEVWHSFEQAAQAIEYVASSNDSVVWYQDIPKESEIYYYPLDFEQRLINYAKVGDLDQVKKLLSIIYEENFKSRSLSIHMSKELIYELKSTIIKLMAQFADEETIKKLLKNIDSSNTIEQNYKLIEDIYNKVCDLVQSQKSSYNLELMNDIKAFIDSNYMDQDLGLYKVSSQFNLSEGYFSHLFKEQTNVNFTDYLEKVRMDHAYELLQNKDISINEIAFAVGYNSAQSFRRAFKRISGVNPTALRKND